MVASSTYSRTCSLTRVGSAGVPAPLPQAGGLELLISHSGCKSGRVCCRHVSMQEERLPSSHYSVPLVSKQALKMRRRLALQNETVLPW